MQRSTLESASGYRPTGAFVLVGAVLLVAAARTATTALRAVDPARVPVTEERGSPPAYSLEDRHGRPLARFVQRLDLVGSPNALWQGHTPHRIAERLAAALGEPWQPAQLLERLMPDAVRGVIRVDELVLDDAQAARVEAWARRGRLEPGGESAPVDGLWLEEAAPGRHRIAWEPAVLLSSRVRARHGLAGNPLAWSRRVADGLWEALNGADALPAGHPVREERRRRLWDALLPRKHAVLVEGLDAEQAALVVRALEDEGVAPHQMRIDRGRERIHPFGGFAVLGSWGFLDQERARERAARELGLAMPFDDGDLALLGRRTREILDERHPVSGLERAADRLLSEEPWSRLGGDPSRFLYATHRAARSRARPYFLASQTAGAAPSVVTTLDAALMIEVGRALDALMVEHRPALSMAIVLEVGSGEVLAVESRAAYQVEGFAPLWHAFTPGSTGKVAVMAAALDVGAVRPSDTFDVGWGEYRLPGRTIHEAESSRTGINTAAECLAYSINAGLVQIGLRVDAAELRGRLEALHYGASPRTGLSGERAGFLPPLPWKSSWTHASICFGHEMTTTLWQHAAALAAIVRGGTWAPLRTLRSVVARGDELEVPPVPGERVFSERACAEVRSMMELGARLGTGSSAVGPELWPDRVVGTKTGTAEKVPSEICLHVELAHQEEHARAGTACARRCRARLAGERRDHRRCYTSSMVAFAADPEGGRELLVLVVADEPRGRERFGSKVAGPTAVRILRAAIDGSLPVEVVEEPAPGFRPSASPLVNPSDAPWAAPWGDGEGGEAWDEPEDGWR